MSAGAPAPAGAAAPLPRWRVFPALALGTLMATLDLSVVNIALPTLARTFRVPLTTVEWVVLAYVVTITGLLLTLGRVADGLGRRRVYAAGLAVFTVASALCAAAPGAGALIAARALQGLGAAMMTANSAALLIANFPPAERGRALGAFGAMVGVGLALGPPLGGMIVERLSWRWIFLVNLPLGVLAWVQLHARVPADPPARPGVRPGLASAALWCATLVATMLALSRGPAHGWGHPTVWPLLAAAAVMAVAFLGAERRAREPLLPLDLLRGPLGATAALTLIGQALSIALGFHLPLYFEEVLGYGTEVSGRWLAVLPLTALVMAPAAGRWADRHGARGLSLAGLGLAAAGFAVLARLGVSPSAARLLVGMALVGSGLGLFTVPNSSALLSAAPPGRLGLASGLQATMRNLGMASGAAVMAALVASRYAAHGGGTVAPGGPGSVSREAFAQATGDAMAVGAVVAVLATTLVWRATVARPRP